LEIIFHGSDEKIWSSDEVLDRSWWVYDCIKVIIKDNITVNGRRSYNCINGREQLQRLWKAVK
jgi:hypothetical protein